MNDDGTLQPTEYHPSADMAMDWFKKWSINLKRYAITREALASTALSGNRLAQILNGTLDRLEKGETVSDRYLLGLCWYLKETENT